MRFGDERVIRAHVRDRPFTKEDRAIGPDLVVRNDPAPQRYEPHVTATRLTFPSWHTSSARRAGESRAAGDLYYTNPASSCTEEGLVEQKDVERDDQADHDRSDRRG